MYTFLSLMAEIGGYVGLLLGVSFFHFTAWISEFIDKKAQELDEDEDELPAAFKGNRKK